MSDMTRRSNWIAILMIPLGGAATWCAASEPCIRNSYNAVATRLPSGHVQAEIHAKWINYLDANWTWQAIQPHFLATSRGFEMTEAPFEVVAPRYADGLAVFRNNNRYDVTSNSRIDEPPLEQSIQALDAAHVLGRIENGNLGWGDVQYVVYPDAFAQLGADLIYWIHQGKAPRLRKFIRFNRPVAADVDLHFRTRFDRNVRVEVSAQQVRIRPAEATTRRGNSHASFYVWDSAAGWAGRHPIRFDWQATKEPRVYNLTKYIPAEFFATATLPVYTDTDVTLYPDPDAETNTFDGECQIGQSFDWNTIRNNTQSWGPWTRDYIASVYIGVWGGGSQNAISRGIFGFYTGPVIPAGATIDSAMLSVYASEVDDDYNDGRDYIAVTHPAPASNTAIDVGDYDSYQGLPGTMTNGSNPIDLTGLASGAYVDFTLNATGLSWIGVGGTTITWLGLCEGHDIEDSSPAGMMDHVNDWLVVPTAENGGTSQDPKLSVTYTEIPPCNEATVDGDPVGDTYCTGDTINLNGSTSGTEPIAYQWRKDSSDLADGGRISGATTDTLTITSAESGDAGDYTLGVMNDCGTDESATATVVVLGGDDCNTNGTPDECDASFGPSSDCNANMIPDECEDDCDNSGTADDCEAGSGVFAWTGLDGGSFSDGGNWNPLGGPGPSGRAAFSNTAAADNRAIVDVPGATTLCSIDIGASGSGRQILQVNEDGVLFTYSGISVADGGHIDLQGGELAGGTVTNTSNSISGYGRVTADVVNSGIIEGVPGDHSNLRLLGGSFDNQATGLLRARLGSLILLESSSPTQSGQIEVRSAGAIAVSASLINQGGATITLLGGTIGSLGQDGITNHHGGDITGFGTIDSSVANNGDMVAYADLQIVGDLANDGTIAIQSGILTVTGNLGGSGTIIGGFGGRGGPDDSASGVVGGAGLLIRGDFDMSTRDWRQIDLTNSVVQMSGNPAGGVQTFEASAVDRFSRSVALPDASLFSIDTLRIGPAPTTVRLIDRHRNSPAARQAGPEAIYVKHLVLDPGVKLDLGGLHLYYETVTPNAPYDSESGVNVIDSVGGGGLFRCSSSARRSP